VVDESRHLSCLESDYIDNSRYEPADTDSHDSPAVLMHKLVQILHHESLNVGHLHVGEVAQLLIEVLLFDLNLSRSARLLLVVHVPILLIDVLADHVGPLSLAVFPLVLVLWLVDDSTLETLLMTSCIVSDSDFLTVVLLLRVFLFY